MFEGSEPEPEPPKIGRLRNSNIMKIGEDMYIDVKCLVFFLHTLYIELVHRIRYKELLLNFS